MLALFEEMVIFLEVEEVFCVGSKNVLQVEDWKVIFGLKRLIERAAEPKVHELKVIGATF